MAYALSGNIHFPGSFPGPKSEKILFGNNPEEDDSRRLDAGLDIIAGYALKPDLFLKAALDWGLINPALSPLKVKTRCLGVMVAYLIK